MELLSQLSGALDVGVYNLNYCASAKVHKLKIPPEIYYIALDG